MAVARASRRDCRDDRPARIAAEELLHTRRRPRTPGRLDRSPHAATGTRPGPFRATWLIAPLALGAAAWFVSSLGALYLTYPPPWPDEALFAEVSTNLLRHGRLSTDLYAEFFPAMRQHYYLTPPLHHVLVAGWFALFGTGVAALRAFSVLAAAGVIGATYAVGRRVGLSRPVALVPAALLALDAVFLRAALLGRMDMLALFLTLLTIWLTLGGTPGAASGRPRLTLPRRAFLLGIISALAILTHPLGAMAAAVSAGWAVIATIPARSERKVAAESGAPVARPLRDILLPAFLGLTVGLLPWALYALRDGHAFTEQIGGQLLRKFSRDWLGSGLTVAVGQWGIDPRLVVGTWIAGAAGLALFCARQPQGRLLLATQLLLTLAVLASGEMWYAVYLVPLTYVGLGSAMSRFAGSPPWQRGLGIAITAVALGCAQQNVARVSSVRASSGLFNGAQAGYSGWCRRIADSLPEGSTVLLDLLPTPYFGLASRHDLALRFFPPAGFKVPEAVLLSSLERMDYIVGGRTLANPEVRRFVMSHGELVAEIGERERPGYYAAVFRVLH